MGLIFKTSSYNWQKYFNVPNLMSLQMLVMQVNGQWPIDFKKYLPSQLSWLARPLVVVYCIFWSFMALHISVFFFTAFIIKLNSGNSTIPEMSTVFTQSIVFGFAFFTTVHFQWNYPLLAEMFEMVLKHFKMRSNRGLTYVTMEPSYLLARLFTVIWTGSCFGAVFYYMLLPIFLQVWELPLNCWYPFDYYPHPIFELVYISQLIGQIEVAVAFALSDVILITMVLFIYAQYDVLFCSLKNIRYTAMLVNSITKNQHELKNIQSRLNLDDEERNEYYYSFEQKDDLDDIKGLTRDLEVLQLKLKENRWKERLTDDYLTDYRDELAVTLRECIIQHQTLIKICNMLERLYNPIVLVKSLQITLQVCNLAFSSTKATSSLLQNINYLIYLFMTLGDLLIYGYAGNWIKEQSIRVGDALLRSPWHLCSGSFRRSLLIILANSMQPIKMTGGKFFVLDYEKVIAVVKASFSFYTLLQKMG